MWVLLVLCGILCPLEVSLELGRLASYNVEARMISFLGAILPLVCFLGEACDWKA